MTNDLINIHLGVIRLFRPPPKKSSHISTAAHHGKLLEVYINTLNLEIA